MLGRLSFLHPSALEPAVGTLSDGRHWLKLMKLCVHPAYRNLVFCGMISTNANEAAIGEMQARWAVAVLTGRAEWPSPTQVDKFVRERGEFLETTKAWYTKFVRYVAYMDDLATAAGVMPELPDVAAAVGRTGGLP